MRLTQIIPLSIRQGVLRRRWIIPMIVSIGVRISWLMLAKNSLFARFASAAALARASTTNIPWRSVISRQDHGRAH